MPHDSNQWDIELLYKNPTQLIIDNHKLIKNIIFLFVRSGGFRFDEHNEIMQHVNEELLNRIPTIQKQFQGKSLLKTYLTTIIKNICNEVIRTKTRTNFINYNEIYAVESSNEAINTLIFKDEMVRLRKAIGFYVKQKAKIILCLKLKFKMPFDYSDFKNVNTNVTQTEFNKFVHQISSYQDCSDTIIFYALTEIFNKYENKTNTSDSLRRWIKLKINELIIILNGSPPSSNYNEETLQILFEKSFFNEAEEVTKIY
jgi:hypothetical protein